MTVSKNILHLIGILFSITFSFFSYVINVRNELIFLLRLLNLLVAHKITTIYINQSSLEAMF